MITTVTNKHRANTYWNMVKHLSPDVKIELITLLSQSLRTKKAHRISAQKYYGVWGDDGMSDEEFLDELKRMRNFKRELIEL